MTHIPASSASPFCQPREQLPYLLARACDLVYFDKHIADLTFPQPTFSGADTLVAALATFLQETQQRIYEENVRKETEKHRPGYETEAAEEAALISVDLPSHLPPRPC